MSPGKKRQISKSRQSTKSHDFSHNDSNNCPRTNGFVAWIRKRPWFIWLLPIVGLISLIWFMIRVVPKPSRATYPCQRLAAPLASGFVVWIAGLIGSAFMYRRAKLLLQKSRYVVAGICTVAAVAIIWGAVSVTNSNPAAAAAFTPSEQANTPMGTAKGINPGRVVWIRDHEATSWDGSTGSWWDDNNTDQKTVDAMLSKAIQRLTGRPSDSQAWDELFKYFNKNRGTGEAGYRKPEKIAIKLNMNQDRRSDWTPDIGNPSPHVVYSLVNQLINKAGVPGSAITLFDATRSIGDPIYNKIRSNPSPDFQNVRFVVNPDRAGSGRIAAEHDTNNPLHTKAGTAYLPKCVTEAGYLINLALTERSRLDAQIAAQVRRQKRPDGFV